MVEPTEQARGAGRAGVRWLRDVPLSHIGEVRERQRLAKCVLAPLVSPARPQCPHCPQPTPCPARSGFWAPAGDGAVEVRTDFKLLVPRVEVRCSPWPYSPTPQPTFSPGFLRRLCARAAVATWATASPTVRCPRVSATASTASRSGTCPILARHSSRQLRLRHSPPPPPPRARPTCLLRSRRVAASGA